eukprot:282430_1
MYTFPDPSEFTSTVPPVPDVKAWLKEFRTKHPNGSTNHKYKQQIHSLNTQNDAIKLEFENISLNNKSLSNDHSTLKIQYNNLQRELFESKSNMEHLKYENEQLKQENKLYSNQIQTLKQQLTLTNNKNINNINNKKDDNIKWNFNCININNNNNNSENELNKQQINNKSRKRPRCNNNNEEDNKKLKLTQDPNNILDRRLPTNLDLIRGDILAEAGGNDQINYCFNMLSKCTTDEWQLRNFLMEMITGLCRENGNILYSIVYENRYIIKKQLTDLRSIVVKSTCEMLITFSKYSDKNKYGQSLAYFIPTHLQGLYVTISCIRDAHNKCLKQSINNIQSFKCINPLLKGLQNKHSEVRVTVINLLSSLINNKKNINNNKKMEKYADAISNTIKTYVSDA